MAEQARPAGVIAVTIRHHSLGPAHADQDFTCGDARVPRSATPSSVTRTLLVYGVLSVLTIGGLVLRVERLRGPEGTLGEDEARLVLAAQGVRATGLPTMPSGKLYLRGVVSTYLTAASVSVLGFSDAAARTPNAVIGALLVPILFLFARALGGTAAGMGAASFAAVEPELLSISTSAWMTSLFLVVFVGAAYLLYLG